MRSRNHALSVAGVAAGASAAISALLALAGCTDVGLYQWKHDPFQANKVTVSGTVCTDDPRQRDFPVKILFVVDASLSIQSDENDPTGFRGKAIDQVLSDLGKNPNYHFGVIGFAGQARNLIDTNFTQDSSKLAAAAASVQGAVGFGGCFAGRCRDVRSAMSLASSIITGDILASDPGEISRTSYVIVLFSGGPPVPAIGRCACRDKQTELAPEGWASCPWDECDGCKVACPPNSTCQDTTCYPVCNPGCGNNQYCDVDYTCKDEPQDGLIGTPTVPPLSSTPISKPDTFNYWIPPQDHSLDLSQTSPVNAGDTPGPCVPTCVFYPGGGHTDSCEERVMVNTVRELKVFAKENGAAQLQVHTLYLPDKVDYSATPTSPFAPLCNDPASDQARTVRLLSEMAFAGEGGFTQFNIPDSITFRNIDLFTTRDPLVIKELVVTNANVMATAGGIVTDTDQDGLPDEIERTLGTCISDKDTDGDGISDAIEIKLDSDPLLADDPIECIDIDPTNVTGDDRCNPGTTKTWRVYPDKDQDTLSACEERLLGTIDSLMDSDADGLPDKVEFIAGTNYLAIDPLQDIDFDGLVNREEVRGHTDPRSNDAQAQLDLAYRYEEVDEGIKEVLSYSQPVTITGVEIKNASSATTPGVGWLEFDPGPPPRLRWKDPSDAQFGGDFGPWVDITTPNFADGYVLTSCRTDGSTGECTKESQERFITVLVEGDQSYPPKNTVDKIRISSALRNCLRFRVRNITLLETGIDPELGDRGNNNILVYFAEAPKNAKDGFGIFRVKSLLLNYLLGPPEIRVPKIAEITLTDDEFVLFE